MDRPGVRQVPEGSGEQGKMEKTGCKIICGAPTTLAVKGLLMLMMHACVRASCMCACMRACNRDMQMKQSKRELTEFCCDSHAMFDTYHMYSPKNNRNLRINE